MANRDVVAKQMKSSFRIRSGNDLSRGPITDLIESVGDGNNVGSLFRIFCPVELMKFGGLNFSENVPLNHGKLTRHFQRVNRSDVRILQRFQGGRLNWGNDRASSEQIQHRTGI